MKFLAQVDPKIKELFGDISPPAAMNIGGSNPVAGLGSFVGFLINMFILFAGMVLIFYLLMGAFDWIASGGDKERIAKAQSKITHALIGMILIFVVLIVFNVLAGNILGIIVPNESGGFNIKIPTLK